MASATESLIGSKTLLKIGVGIVLFVVVSSAMTDCSAKDQGKRDHAQMVSEATPESAKAYCLADLREKQVDKYRDKFEIIDTRVEQRSDIGYSVYITYKSYSSNFTGTVYPGNTRCRVDRQMYGWYKYGS